MEISGVRVKSILELVASNISMIIRRLGRPQQRQPHDILTGRVAVFAVIEQSDTAAVLREIRKLVAADFKLGHIPRGVLVRGSSDDTVCGFVGSKVREHVKGKLDFEEFAGFVPLYVSVELEDRRGGVEDNSLGERRGRRKRVFNLNDGTERSKLDNLWGLGEQISNGRARPSKQNSPWQLPFPHPKTSPNGKSRRPKRPRTTEYLQSI